MAHPASNPLVDRAPGAEAVVAFLNAATTTFEVLDLEVGLDRRAAQNLIARRDQAPFTRIEDIDAVPWVGEAALRQLRAFVDPPYGVVEGVGFTMSQARATLELANRAPFDVLDGEVPLDRRAARGIVEGRPFATLEEVSAAFYVGPSALVALRGAADRWAPPGLLSTRAAETALAQATVGLVHISDIDVELTVVTVPGVRTIDVTTAKTVLAEGYVPRAGERSLEERIPVEVSLARMFDDYTVEDAFWGEEQYAIAGPCGRCARSSRCSSPTRRSFASASTRLATTSGAPSTCTS